MHPQLQSLKLQTRRHCVKDSGLGVGALALSSLLADEANARTPNIMNPLAPREPHFPARARRIIYLHLTGSPPHLDLYDYKPELVKRDGQPCPDAFTKGKRFAFTSGTPKLLGTRRQFARHGKGGVWLSDAIPHLHGVADELRVVKSMFTEQFNHAPPEFLLCTASSLSRTPSIRPSLT